MLAEPLLRARSRNRTVTPLFITTEEEVELAGRIIDEFKEAWKNREKKAELEARIEAVIESGHEGGSGVGGVASSDRAKLVRGLYALLERRCVFLPATTSSTTAGAFSPALLNPAAVRRAVFEESSRRGLALTPSERAEIAGAVAAKLQAPSADAVLEAMWGDLEDNLVLDRFDDHDRIDARALAGWYNLALMQTLLFRSTRLDFSVSGGRGWKHVLRQVKRLGLMYYLHAADEEEGNGGNAKKSKEKKIACSLEGPPGLFKLTDRYGTALAKLLPHIVFSGGRWEVRAWVLRKTMDGNRAEYEFRMSDSTAPALLADPFYQRGRESQPDERQQQHYSFDSAVEEKFAQRFASVAGGSNNEYAGWKLVREPDPLVVSGGRAFIPDFLFAKPGRKKVYLEIVGFWTPEYLERKFQKLADIFGSAYSARLDDSFGGQQKEEMIELFIALDEDLACSSMPSFSHMQRVMPRGRLIFYRKGSVPVSPILECLKAIDREAVERSTGDPGLKAELDPAKDAIVAVGEVARRMGDGSLPAEAVLKIVKRDYGDRYVEVAGTHLVSREKAGRIGSALAGVERFTDACALLAQEGIPESCQAALISKLGYDVVWESLDPGSATLVKRTQ